MSGRKAVLITGVSSGIGRATARRLAERDLTVFGTSRNPESVEPITGVEVFPLDVRSGESAAACVDAVLERAGRLDVLVNNAGYVLGGALEATTLEEAKAQFETNFWGAVRMIHAALPAMRKQGGGQIINITSLVGLVPVPFLGFYSASKFALEGYTEALRHEVRPFGIRVSAVEPGFIKTHLARNAEYVTDRIHDYDPWRERAFGAIQEYIAKAPDPSIVADRVLRIIESRSPKLRFRVGKEARSIFRLRRFAPERLFERGVRRNFRL